MKKLLSVILAFIIIVSIIPFAFAETSEIITSGFCNPDESVKFVLYSDGTMVLSGNGFVYNTMVNSDYDSRWNGYGNYIKYVVIEEGITGIAEDSLRNYDSIETVIIPDSVERLERRAFFNNNNLKTVSIGSGIKYNDESFINCFGLKDIYYNNTEEHFVAHFYGSKGYYGCRIHYSSTLDNHPLTAVDKIPATCTEKGLVSLYCPCGYLMGEEECDVTEHADINKDGYCDYCNEYLNEMIDNCTHFCHSDGFVGFMWKIINFFNKLFKINPTCSCGAAHY